MPVAGGPVEGFMGGRAVPVVINRRRGSETRRESVRGAESAADREKWRQTQRRYKEREK